MKIPSEVLAALAGLDLPVTQENHVTTLMNAHNPLVRMESVVSLPCALTSLEVMVVDAHPEVPVILSFNVYPKIIVSTMTPALGMQFVVGTNVTVSLPMLGMIANVSHFLPLSHSLVQRFHRSSEISLF